MAQLYDANGNPAFTDVVSQLQTPGALNAAVAMQLRGQSSASVQVTGIGSLTLIFEVTTDNVNWDSVIAYPIAGGLGVLTTTANGHWIVPIAGAYGFRVRVSAYTSGNATVSVVCSQGTMIPPTNTVGMPFIDIKQWADTSLGTPTNFGTGPGAVIAASANVSLFAGTSAAGGAIAAAYSAGAVSVGLKAASANPANATALQAVAPFADLAGRMVVTPVNPRALIGKQATTISATGATTIVTAGAAGVFNDLTMLIITTAGLAAQTITISDGTLSWIIDYPNAAVAPGTPLIIDFGDVPLPATTAATAWTANQGAATACHYLAVFAQRLA